MLKNLDVQSKKMLKLLLFIVIGFILILIIVAIIGKTKNSSLTYSEIESKMVGAAKEYFSDRNDALPINDSDRVSVSTSLLVEEGYLKDLSKYQKDSNASCSGEVIVTKSGSNYNYSPYLNCGDKYTTTYLYERLLQDVVSKDDGLYKTTQYYNGKGNKTTYVYKGDYANNYVKIDDSLWRIVKIDGEYDIMLVQDFYDKQLGYNGVWDNRYNSELKESTGINDYYKSIIRKNVNEYYESFSEFLKSKIVQKDLCISERSSNATKNDGSVECKKVLSEEYIGLLNTHDYINASLDSNCKKVEDRACFNYNYLTDYERSFWFLNTSAERKGRGYKYSTTGVTVSKLSTNARARVVINITKNTIYAGGNGTYENPFIIK